MINIDTTELQKILDRTPASQNIMLVGRHGIGKSEILTNYFRGKGMRVVTLFLGQMSDPGDLIGLPHRDEATGHTEFMPPYWFPTDGAPVALFLDELNRARPEVLQTIMDLALNRRLAGRSLPDGSRLISAVNDGEEYQLTDLDPALVSRFNVYAFRPTRAEWLLWASQSGLDKRVIGFISENGEWLDGTTDSTPQMDMGLEKTPDRRAWRKVSDLIAPLPSLDNTDAKAVAGIVGSAAAAKFMAYASENRLVSGRQLLLDFDGVKDAVAKYKVHELAVVNESVFRFLETEGGDLPKEERQKAGQSLKAYTEMLSKGKKKEALAEFANTYGSKAYPRAIVFIVSNAPEAYDKIIKFVQNL